MGHRARGMTSASCAHVAGQQYAYLLRQLQDTREGRRPNMQAQHRRLIASCSVDESASLADYMARRGAAARQ